MINTELITEEEFLTALEVCRKYKNQLNKEIIIFENTDKTSFCEFYRNNIKNDFFKTRITGALMQNILKNMYNHSYDFFIEDVSDEDFLRWRCAGKVSLAYFKEMKKHFNIN